MARVRRTSDVSAPCSPSQSPSGFTLVEVLIVVVIAAIVAALAMPLLAETDSTRLAAAARLLMADLGFAQVESITHGDDPCVVVFDQ
ncbi:MAG: prepilin-type N-terminal cleavage/methylation domain-containing protein, partial [Planctomycetota bacterium]